MLKIKPCPFCGSEDVEPRTASIETWIACKNCHANGPVIYFEKDRETTENKAVQKWNVVIERLLAALYLNLG